MQTYELSTSRLFYSAVGNCRPSSGIAFIRLPLNKEVDLLYTPEYYSWRILLQVCDMQLRDYELANNGDREQWKSRLLDTLQRINEKAQNFTPQLFPCDIKPATAESAALSVSGANWCDAMTNKLSKIFLNVQIVGTSKIEVL